MTPITKPLQRAHSDLWGFNNLVSIRGNHCFVVIIDINIRKIWTYSIASKNMFFSVFKIWKNRIETNIRLKLSGLKMAERGRYFSLILKKFCNKKRIVMKFTLAYMPEQNFIAK